MRLLLLSLALILFGDIGAYLVKTAAGTVDVTGFKIPTQNGQWVAADLFRPRSGTAKGCASEPCGVLPPGWMVDAAGYSIVSRNVAAAVPTARTT